MSQLTIHSLLNHTCAKSNALVCIAGDNYKLNVCTVLQIIKVFI